MSQQIFCKDIQAHPIDCNCAGRVVPSGGQAPRNRPHENPDCRCEACRMHDDPLTAETAKIVEAVAEQARAMLVATLDRMPAEPCARIGDTVTGGFQGPLISGTIDPSHFRNGYMSERDVVAELARRAVVNDAGDGWVDGAVRHLAQLKIASDASRKAAERYAELMGVGLHRDGMPERPMLHYEAERERREYARSHGYFWISCPRCGQMFGGHEWRATIACSRDTDVGHGACCHGPGVDPDACARAHERDQE